MPVCVPARMNLKSIMLRGKERVEKDHILYDSIYTKCLAWANLQRKENSGCVALRKIGGNGE